MQFLSCRINPKHRASKPNRDKKMVVRDGIEYRQKRPVFGYKANSMMGAFPESYPGYFLRFTESHRGPDGISKRHFPSFCARALQLNVPWALHQSSQSREFLNAP